MKAVVYILMLVLTIVSAVSSQTVEWKRINSEAEFAVAMPDGSVGLKDGTGFLLSKNARVTKRTFVYRYISGNSLMLEMYEGDVSEIRDQLVWRLGLGTSPYKLIRSEDVPDVSVRTYARESDNSYSVQQLLLFAKRLYVVQGHASSKESKILTAMLGSVTVSSSGKMLMPNLSAGSDAVAAALPTSIVEAKSDTDPTKAYEGKPDSNVVVVYKPRPRYSTEARAQGSQGLVTVNVLFGANGQVLKVKPMSGDVLLRNIVTAAAEKILFLPAQKDGKSISVWKTLNYSFEIY